MGTTSTTRLQLVSARAAQNPASPRTVGDGPEFPSRPMLLRHLQALQIVARQRPHTAKAILDMTERFAQMPRRRQRTIRS